MQTARRARDEWLALRCLAGEPGAFEALIAELERPLFYYLLQIAGGRDAALELLQETWVLALRKFKSLNDPASVRAWLYALAHGIAIDHIRRNQTRARAEEQYADAAEGDAGYDFTALDAEAIHEALAQLSPAHREVLALHFLEDFPLAEIARIIDCPEGTVKSRIHHGKAQMRAILLEGGYGQRK